MKQKEKYIIDFYEIINNNIREGWIYIYRHIGYIHAYSDS